MKKKFTDTSEAEKWLDADTFIVKGKVYRIKPDGTIKEIKKMEKQPLIKSGATNPKLKCQL